MSTKKIDSRYRLLHLIYEGKTSGILTDSSLKGSLNDLMKYELVAIYNNKLRLTERGKNALKNGIGSVLTKVRNKPGISPTMVDSESHHLTELVITISILLLVILLFLLF